MLQQLKNKDFTGIGFQLHTKEKKVEKFILKLNMGLELPQEDMFLQVQLLDTPLAQLLDIRQLLLHFLEDLLLILWHQ